MSQTYQLSKSGIERLERFKRDVLAGDFEISARVPLGFAVVCCGHDTIPTPQKTGSCSTRKVWVNNCGISGW